MFRPVFTVANEACAGYSQQTKNTSELSGIIEALQFLMPLGACPTRLTRLVFFDSQHDADVCLRSIQTRTNVRLVGLSEHLLLQVQLRVSLTLPHIYSNVGYVGHECADHAVALGSWTLIQLQPYRTLAATAVWYTHLLRNCNDLADIKCVMLVANAHLPIRPVLHASCRSVLGLAVPVTFFVTNSFVSYDVRGLDPFCALHVLFSFLRRVAGVVHENASSLMQRKVT